MFAYLEGPSPIHSLDPRIKIAWSVAVSLLAVIFRQPWFLAGLFTITLLPWCLVRPPLSRLRFLLAAVGTTVFGTTLSFNHFKHPEKTLYSTHRGVRPGGQLVIGIGLKLAANFDRDAA